MRVVIEVRISYIGENAVTRYVLENDWKSLANFQRRYVFTVVQMISSNKFGRNCSAWDTSCSVAILTLIRLDRKLRARFLGKVL